MNDLLSSYTALPNLHPAVVHFPIALLMLAVACDAIFLIRPRLRWLEQFAVTLYLVGAASAGMAYLTGRQAADQATNVPASAERLLAQHSDWAWRTFLWFALLGLLKALVVWRQRHRGSIRVGLLRPAILAGALVGQWMIYETADRGGALVYRHGVMVAALPTAPGGSDVAPPAAAEVVTRRADRDELHLDLQGRTELMLPGNFDHVQVTALLDLTSFSGTVGLLHRSGESRDGIRFEVSSTGDSALRLYATGRRESLDDAVLRLTDGETRLKLSVARGHLKGTLNDEPVLHGHVSTSPGGPVGLLLDGEGVVRVLSITAIPLEED